MENAIRRLRRQSFRAYVHDVNTIERLIAAGGPHRVASARRLIWYIAIHERNGLKAKPVSRDSG